VLLGILVAHMNITMKYVNIHETFFIK
jgi:hypothetical protein